MKKERVVTKIRHLLSEADADLMRASRAVNVDPYDGNNWAMLIKVARRNGHSIVIDWGNHPIILTGAREMRINVYRGSKKENYYLNYDGGNILLGYYLQRKYIRHPLYRVVPNSDIEAGNY